MKLAFCLFNYFPYGGLQRDFMRIALECQSRGHEIHVYTMSWEGEVPQGFHLHRMKKKGWQNHTRIHFFTKQVEQAIKQTSYDVVVGFNKMPLLDVYYAADVCYQARIHNARSFLSRLLPRYHRFVQWEKEIFSRGQQTDILLISPLQQAVFMQHYQTEPERFHLLPPGIARDRIAPSHATEIRHRVRTELNFSANHQMLLMVGSGFKTKGVDRAILALAALPSLLRNQTHLVIVGQDDARPFLKLAKHHGVDQQLLFLGGRDDVAKFFLAADLLLHPSYHENTGTVLLEAIIAGLPVLTLDVCGYAHYVSEAKAGVVLSSPFQQRIFNETLQAILLAEKENWRRNGLAFAQDADIYRMPQVAADFIEHKKLNTIKKKNFDEMMRLRGEIFRYQKGRVTQRVKIEDQTYFIKQHKGVGWKEIFKNMLQGRWPVLSAENEYLAIQVLQALQVNVPSVMAYERKGYHPARLQSYILLEELRDVISLEDLAKTWKTTPPHFSFKRKLIEEVARIARVMHDHGINHRDFYLCHFLLDLTQFKIYLIDLHRAQLRRQVPQRWLMKDLAALLFSCKEVSLTQRDFFRFIKIYCAGSLRNVLTFKKDFWQKIALRGHHYRDHTQP